MSSEAVQGYGEIQAAIVRLLETAPLAVARSINAAMTATYWEIGRRIVEFEQRGAGAPNGRVSMKNRYDESPVPSSGSAKLNSTFGHDVLAGLLEISTASLLRYQSGERQVPDAVAERAHFLTALHLEYTHVPGLTVTEDIPISRCKNQPMRSSGCYQETVCGIAVRVRRQERAFGGTLRIERKEADARWGERLLHPVSQRR